MERTGLFSRSGRVACAAALSVSLACCGGGDTDGGDETSETSTSDIPSSSTVSSSPDPGCTEDLPRALIFTPENEAEAVLNGHLSGCTDGAFTQLRIADESPVPWVLDEPAREWVKPSEHPEIEILRAAVRGRPGLVIAPGEDASFDLPPEQLHLTLTAESAAAWYGLKMVSTQVQELAQDKFVETLADGRPARRAALTCAVAGAEFGLEIQSQGGDGQSGTDTLDIGLELAGAGVSSVETCGGAIQRAEQELVAEGADRQALVTLEKARKVTTAQRPQFIPAFGLALRRGLQIILS